MIEKLEQLLRQIGKGRQQQLFQTGFAVTWWVGGFLAIILLLLDFPAGTTLGLLFAILVLVSVLVYVRSCRGMNDPRKIALEIEQKHPELQTALLAALDQHSTTSSDQLSYLQSRLIAYSLDLAKTQRWSDSVSINALPGRIFLSFLGVGFFLFVFSAVMFYAESEAETLAELPAIEILVEPGDIELEAGDPLTIQARFDMPPTEEVSLEMTYASGEIVTRSMIRPFTDPAFQLRLDTVTAPMSYRVLTEEAASEDYQVTLFEKPALVGSEASVRPPSYAEEAAETIQDPVVIRVVEGTEIDLSLFANRPELTAQLRTRKGETLDLEADPADPLQFTNSIRPSKDVRYEIVLTDSKGRRNGRRDVINIKVTPNKAPVIRVVLPRKNDQATPIQEVHIEAEVVDKTGLLDYGLRYSLDGESWTDVSRKADSGIQRPRLAHVIDLEAAGAQPNDLIMWNAWATDMAPDGRERTVRGDVQIIPVRSFDREVYQKAAQPSEDGMAAQGLIESQKQILDATWGVVREHSEIRNTEPKADELETLYKSQEVVIGMAQRLEARINDPSIRRHLTDARLEMIEAKSSLEEAFDEISLQPLHPAINHEQTALRHLQRLMSNRKMIVQSQGSQPSEGEERSLEDLDLKLMQNPYESERAAQAEAGTEAQEAMEILKRLDALAKRLRDLNEEIKALQMAINKAETEAERLENKRRLERLREQQRELLAGIDNLKDKSDEQASDAQKAALDEIREETRRASEDLSMEKLGDALAAGRRAQESVEQLHDEFKETSAVKLAQQLRNLRESARALEDRQRELGKQMGQTSSQSQLRSETDQDVAEDIAAQQAAYQELVEALGETAETAEGSEPLVAKDLHQALREADQNGIADALEAMDSTDKTAAAEHASDAIAALTRKIEKATERILGNEAQALRYARNEIERLADEMKGGTRPGESPQPGEGEEPGESLASSKGPGTSTEQSDEPGDGETSGRGEGSETASADQPGEGSAQTAQAGTPGSSEGSVPGNEEGSQGSSGNSREASSGDLERMRQAQASSAGRSGDGGRRNASLENGYGEWRDRIEDLQAVIDDPEALTEITRAYRAAQSMRKDFRQSGNSPSPERINQEIVQPLEEAARAVDARLAALNREDPLAPVNRDPVPERYEELVSNYFEALAQ